MKSTTIRVLLLILASTAVSDAGWGARAAWRVAQSANACLTNCASQNDSCKRICPTTYNGPCISACDNQAQVCRQACQGR